MKKGMKTKYDDPIYKIILFLLGYLVGVAFCVVYVYNKYGFLIR